MKRGKEEKRKGEKEKEENKKRRKQTSSNRWLPFLLQDPGRREGKKSKGK